MFLPTITFNILFDYIFIKTINSPIMSWCLTSQSILKSIRRSIWAFNLFKMSHQFPICCKNHLLSWVTESSISSFKKWILLKYRFIFHNIYTYNRLVQYQSLFFWLGVVDLIRTISPYWRLDKHKVIKNEKLSTVFTAPLASAHFILKKYLVNSFLKLCYDKAENRA